MNAAAHERIMDLFNAAAELPADERAAFLARSCGHDHALRAEVEALLGHDSSSCVLDRPPAGGLIDVARLADASVQPPPLPERIGRYRIAALVGRGAMGMVYRAEQEAPARTVALKVLRPELATERFRRRFALESETLARLRHPCIARLYDAGVADTPSGPQPYLAMEFVAGLPLRAYAQAKQLDVAARLMLLARICDGVEHAHQRGVIHRDLKPANILVEDADDGPRPCILDFGVARLIEPDAAAITQVTEPGQLLGTLAYMSPEQVDGDPAEVDTRTDVYALGVLGYELLGEALPIDLRGRTTFAALRAVRDVVPPPLAVHGRAFRGDLTTIMSKALAKDKEQRYGSAAALAADVRRYLAGRPVLAHPPSVLYELRKFARRNRALVALTVTAVVLLVAAVGGTSYGLLRARAAADRLRLQYREASESAGFLASNIVANLDRLAGTAEVRRALLTRLQGQVERQLAAEPDDPQLLDSFAEILMRRSDLDLSEGRADAALAQREQVLALRRRVALLEPADPLHRANVASALTRIGDVYRERGDFETARTHYGEALALFEDLARARPDAFWCLSNLAWCYSRLGHHEWKAGRPAESQAYLDQQLALLPRLLEIRPDDVNVRFSAWQARVVLAELAQQRGDAPAVAEHMRVALDHATRMIEAAPQNRQYLGAYGQTALRRARQLADGQQPAAALALVKAAEPIIARLHLLEPTQVSTAELHCQVLVIGASSALAVGEVQRAALLAERAVEVAEELVRRQPDAENYRQALERAQALRAQAVGAPPRASVPPLDTAP